MNNEVAPKDGDLGQPDCDTTSMLSSSGNAGDDSRSTEKIVVHVLQDRVAYVRRPDGTILAKDLTRPDSDPVEMIDIGEG